MSDAKFCVRCGNERDLNRKHVCEECAITTALATTRQLNQKRGPYYDKWLRRTKASIDDLYLARWPDA